MHRGAQCREESQRSETAGFIIAEEENAFCDACCEVTEGKMAEEIWFRKQNKAKKL